MTVPLGVPKDELDKAETVRLIGRVKWFDATKGYGFVIPETATGRIIESDVMLHISCLRNFGETFADEGARIVCDAVERDRGWQAVNIVEMDRPRASRAAQTSSSAESEPVRVKWFNASKGFGFVNRPGEERDIFIHVSVLRKGGRESVQPNDELEVVVGVGTKGHHVIEVRPDNEND